MSLPHLAASDPIMARIIATAKPLAATAHEDLYRALLNSILSQQLSVKAARTIRGRMEALFPDNYPAPELLLALPVEALRGAGVSGQKAGYLRAVAEFAQRGELEYGQLRDLDEEALTRHLTQIKGVGRWTAQMLLMFALGRPDVFPEGDLGIQNAMRRHYELTETGKPLLTRMQQIAEAWRPHRTTASRLLWQSLDNEPK